MPRPAPPWTPSREPVTPSPIATRKGTPAFNVALAVGAIAVVVSLALVRYLAADQEYEVADTSFETQAVPSDPESTVAPIAKAPASPPVSAAAIPAAAAVVTPTVRQIAAATQPVAEEVNTPSRKATKPVEVPVPAPTTIATPVAVTHEPEAVAAPAAENPSATRIAPSPVAPAAAAPIDEVTITGCLEIAKDEAGFRLSDTEGADAPQSRSWRSGFFKKRPAPLDLIVSTRALSLQREVGQRIAATGVLSSRKLKVRSVRVVSSSCN